MAFITQMRDFAWMFSLSSVLLVFIGWRVTYSNQMKIATRSESKSIVDALAKTINDVSDASISFWLKESSKLDKSDPDSVAKASNAASEYIMIVLAKASQATRYCSLLTQRGMTSEVSAISILIEKATLDCETAFMESASFRSQRTNDVLLACMEMMEDVYDEFQITYPPSSHKSLSARMNAKLNDLDYWHNSLR